MQGPDLDKIKKRIDEYFLKTDDLQEKGIYQFFTKEIKSKDIMGMQTDIPIIGKSQIKRKYVLALWRVSNFSQTIPWIRIALPDNNTPSSLEIVLPVFHSDMPKFWSKGKSYFRFVTQYKPGKHGPTIQLFTNPVDTEDIPEILEIVTKFHRKIRTYSSSQKV